MGGKNKKKKRERETNDLIRGGIEQQMSDRNYLDIFHRNCGLIRFPTNLFNHDRSRIHVSSSERERERDTEREREGEIERRRDSLNRT